MTSGRCSALTDGVGGKEGAGWERTTWNVSKVAAMLLQVRQVSVRVLGKSRWLHTRR